MSPKRYNIGYAFSARKTQTFLQPSLLRHAALHNIDFVAVDTSTPLTQQGPFDCITHKLYGPDWISNLSHFSSLHPNVPIIDSPSAISRLHDRISMLQLVQRLNVPNLHVPKQHVVQNDSDKAKALSEMSFPVIAKPVVADGSDASHKMCMLFDEEGLEKLDAQVGFVLQEFVNHGGVLFKVYVAGDYIQCVKRRSLPDMKEEKQESLKGLVAFSRVSSLQVERYVEMPETGFVEEIVKGMREELGIRLFNFDLLRDGRDENRYLVVDINYFPGFEKLPDYESLMTRFFLDVLGKKENGGAAVFAEEGKERNGS